MILVVFVLVLSLSKHMERCKWWSFTVHVSDIVMYMERFVDVFSFLSPPFTVWMILFIKKVGEVDTALLNVCRSVFSKHHLYLNSVKKKNAVLDLYQRD